MFAGSLNFKQCLTWCLGPGVITDGMFDVGITGIAENSCGRNSNETIALTEDSNNGCIFPTELPAAAPWNWEAYAYVSITVASAALICTYIAAKYRRLRGENEFDIVSPQDEFDSDLALT